MTNIIVVMCPNVGIFSGFPPMGWISFCIFGLLYGRILLRNSNRKLISSRSAQSSDRQSKRDVNITLEASISLIFALAFFATRYLQFGNLSTNCLPKGSTKDTNQYFGSVKAFFYVVKYPPSPSFAFFSLAINFGLLVLFEMSADALLVSERLVNKVRSSSNPLLVFGRQSLFFYATHIMLIQLISIPIQTTPLVHKLSNKKWHKPPGEVDYGIDLGPAYFLIWASVLLILYPICQAYGRFKARKSAESVWRFL